MPESSTSKPATTLTIWMPTRGPRDSSPSGIRHSGSLKAIDSSGVHVAATTDETIAGFIVVTDPPARTAANLPGIVRAMLDLSETAEMTRKPIAARSYAFRGPVCID